MKALVALFKAAFQLARPVRPLPADVNLTLADLIAKFTPAATASVLGLPVLGVF